jgi:hypothetical protein
MNGSNAPCPFAMGVLPLKLERMPLFDSYKTDTLCRAYSLLSLWGIARQDPDLGALLSGEFY